jgi:hypothetical protein
MGVPHYRRQTMSTPRQILDRAQEIRDYLDQDYKYRAAHDGFDDYAWTAERGLAALLGTDEVVHAWIEPTEENRLDHAGTIRVLTAQHLLTAEYGRGKHGVARLEPSAITRVSLETTWSSKTEDKPSRPSYVLIKLERDLGDLTIEALDHTDLETRSLELIEKLPLIKSGMKPITD